VRIFVSCDVDNDVADEAAAFLQLVRRDDLVKCKAPGNADWQAARTDQPVDAGDGPPTLVGRQQIAILSERRKTKEKTMKQRRLINQKRAA